MTSEKLVFRAHALRRMFRRGIGLDEVHQALSTGETIESYPQDIPYPSRLVLGWSGNRALHIVTADNTEDRETIVITVYEPDPALWNTDFRRRKP
ncbi:MAG: DUF4258 domain-containing protein [Acidobacteriia bacterium]|nr:DUF4258 domain-containing protein [Terriglobia bacterium]